PPFHHWHLGTNADPCIFSYTDISISNNCCIIALLEGFCEEVVCSAIIDSCSQKVVVHVSQFEIGAILRLQEWISGFVSIIVKEEQEWIQVLVSRTVDATAKICCKCMFLVGCVT